MRSMRRGTSMTHRDMVVQNGDICFDSPSPPKTPPGWPYFALGRLLNSFDFLMVVDRIGGAFSRGSLLQRHSRIADKSKSRGLQLKRIFFHFFICFMLGIFISLATSVSVDVSKKLVSKKKAFSFEEDLVLKDTHYEASSVKTEALALDSLEHNRNHSLDAVAKWEVKEEVIEASNSLRVSYVVTPSTDLELASRKLLIIVTPTYARPFQAYYLNRLAHTLRVVSPPLLWIVVEMSSQSTETAKLLRETGVMYRHLVCNQNLTSVRNREVHQRNVALSHIEKHQLDGIVHFADDDRIYSVELFDQMQNISRFGTWPVAVLAKSKNKVSLEGPVCNGSQVIGWHTYQRNKLSRRFHVDMSGFAFNSTILWDPKRWRRPTLELIRQHDSVKEGFQETSFIEDLVEDESQMEGLPNNCSKVMVWHLHVEAPELSNAKGWLMEKNLEVVAPLT